MRTPDDRGRSARVLVVDDEPAMQEVLAGRLERWGYVVEATGSVATARARAAAFRPDVVVSDLVLPDATGLDLLEQLRAEDPRRTVLLITAYGTIDTAVRAIKAGACHFLTKPIDYGVLKTYLEAAPLLGDEDGSSTEEPRAAPSPSPPSHTATEGPWRGMVGTSPALRRMQERVRAAAASDAPVLIVGESGTGKELVARTIRELSLRASRPYVTVNAAALPETLVESELFGAERGAFSGADRARAGLLEQADGGTLFLDEITEMPLSLQPKLLRALEDGRVRRLGGSGERTVDVRVIAATNRNPTVAVEQGRLRHDLAFRLDVLRVDVPPLRERREDLPALAAHFLDGCARRLGAPSPSLSPSALAALEAHPWPGNVRELRNVMERAFVSGASVLEAEHLGLPLPTTASASASASAPSHPMAHGIAIPAGRTLAEAEQILILETLRRTGNNKAEAARQLGLDVKTIRNKLKHFSSGTGTAAAPETDWESDA